MAELIAILKRSSWDECFMFDVGNCFILNSIRRRIGRLMSWIAQDYGWFTLSCVTQHDRLFVCWLTIGANVSCRHLMDVGQVLTCPRQLLFLLDWNIHFIFFVIYPTGFSGRHRDIYKIYNQRNIMATLFFLVLAMSCCCWTLAGPTTRNEAFGNWKHPFY